MTHVNDNPLLKSYCDGAAMAYLDMANILRKMISDAPQELKPFMEATQPFIDACEHKAKAVYEEADKFLDKKSHN